MKEKTWSELFREYRELRGYSQARLAERLTEILEYNVSRDTVKNWEMGRNKPKIVSRPRLRELLNKAGIS